MNLELCVNPRPTDAEEEDAVIDGSIDGLIEDELQRRTPQPHCRGEQLVLNCRVRVKVVGFRV